MRRPARRLRTALTAFTVAALLAGCGAFGDAPTQDAGEPRPEGQAIRVGLPTGVTSFANSDLAVAIEKGFLAEEGLTVEAQNLRSGVSVVQGVVGGALEIGAASIEPVVNAAAGGGDVVIIGAYTDKLTVSSVAPAEVQTPADLRGRQVGVQEVGAFREVMTRMVLNSVGLTQDDVEYIPVDAQSYNAALVDGRIQNAILQTEQAIAVQRDHPGMHTIAELDTIVPEYHYGTYFVSRAWLEANQETAVKFLRAITRAHRFMYENKQETVQIVARTTEFDEDVISQAYDILLGQKGVFPVNTGIDKARIKQTINRMRELAILENEPPVYEELVNPNPIIAAVDSLGVQTGDARWR
ncbi:MAG TPA: ABC transporter substrate-binding protein [Pseudonocardia sp.]|jgi:ABC-type nitrate/sulfonate/bicarbonate transport system substrate-binding protein|uniref:ABC transporter substrate-binding protein n=1 Tax=Pseudonocardia sp. TaxID=60912 RepID=UPI002B4B5E75|nr:ABC transporter substrate-binding protein [Pseudonocardia sp.]HLU59555.1 ABC transporter substrate-binding protein [Pseudonocardia sp.]